ncbi:MAG: hypothetical protein R2724_07240 [Bryobacterales bacterium]
MRKCVFLIFLAFSSLLAQNNATPPRVEQLSNGVVIVRGGSSRAPGAPAKQDEAKAAEAAPAETQKETDKKETAKAEKPPRLVESEATIVLPGGATREENTEDTVRRSDGVTEAIRTLKNINGQTVPYLTDREETLSKTPTSEVKERVVQRYDASGTPTTQEITKIETRKLGDGTVVTTETLYKETLNGRMEAIQRKTSREVKNGAVTRTVTSTDAPSVNGGFQTILKEESVERKIGENRAEKEVTRSARVGSGLAVVAREQSTMSKSGSTSTTETTVYERNAATNQLGLSARKVGRLTENADGSQTEKVETYGFKTGSGATNINATRPELQEVVDRRVTVGSGGEVRETTRVQQRGIADTATMTAGPTTEVVVKPTADGESRRTEIYERGVNGRSNATRVIVEKVEK